MQAFLDQALAKAPDFSMQSHTIAALLPVAFNLDVEQQELEYWYVNQCIQLSEEVKQFRSILCRTEWYQLVRFLLKESEENVTGKLRDLGAQYGLSAAHFRRLSSRALGQTTKVELKYWRLTRALLDLMGEKKSMTSIAIEHGYASSAHFSREVKEVFGVSLREIKNAMTGGSKNEVC